MFNKNQSSSNNQRGMTQAQKNQINNLNRRGNAAQKTINSKTGKADNRQGNGRNR